MPLLPAAYRALPTSTKTLLAVDAFSAFGTGLVLPFLVVYLHRGHHYSPAMATAVVATVSAASLGGNLAAGQLIDHLSAKRASAFILGMAATGSLLYALTAKPWMAFAAAIAYGLGVGGVPTLWFALLASVTPPEQRKNLFGLHYANLNLMMGAGAVVGGVVAAGGAVVAYRALYAVDALTFLGCAAAIAVVAPADLALTTKRKPSLREYPTILADRRLRRVLVLSLAVFAVGFGQVRGTLPAVATAHGHITPAILAAGFAVNTFAVAVAQVALLPRVTALTAARAVSYAGLCWAASWTAVLVAAVITDVVTAAAVLFAGMVAFAVGETFLAPTLPTLVNDLATDEDRGRYNATNALANSAGSIAATSSAAVAFTLVSPSSYLAVVTAACLALPLLGRSVQRAVTGAAPVPQAPPQAANHGEAHR